MWLIEGFKIALSPLNLGVAFIACWIGTLVGVLPGLGPTSAVALLFPISILLPPETALMALGAIFYGAMYGGSTTAILLNIPGEISSVPATIEGYPLTKRGRGGAALVICAVVSFMGGILALLGLAFFAPILAEFALTFGPYEYFSLMVFSLTCVAGLSGRSLARGIALGCLGLFLALVGAEPGSDIFRLTFNSTHLYSGFDVISVVIGLFGISEVLIGIQEETKAIFKGKIKIGNLMPNGPELSLGLKAGLRGSILGTVLGLLPGVLPSISAFISYSVEGKVAKERHLFGKGAMEGIAGPEAANNATAVAGFIPLMALGIPTGPVMAIVLAALLVHGVIPGPLMFTTHKTLTSAVIASFFVGNVILVILNIPLVGIWVRLAMIPYRILAPIILSLCFWGAYCIRNSVFDIWVAVGFGLLGYVMKKYNLPAAPFVLGFILGDPIELHLRQVMALGPFSLTLQHPIAMALLTCAVIVVILYTVFREKREVVSAIEED